MPTPAVEDGERLYRQVKPNASPLFFDPNSTPPVHRSLFLPTKQDKDGLSFVRARFRTAIWAAFRSEQPNTRFQLAIVSIQAIGQLTAAIAIHFETSPDGLDTIHGEPWGHCTALEVNRTDYDDNPTIKQFIKEWAERISRGLASADVIGPFAAPADINPYRPDTGPDTDRREHRPIQL